MFLKMYGKEEIENLTKVIESGMLADHAGGFMDQFRDDFARATGAKHAISGATAMLLMQVIPPAIGAGPGDEIICDPIVQFHAIACLHNNVIPVWTDVKPDDFQMDPEQVEKKITKRTKAIWVTHMFGFPAEVDKLRKIADKHGIYLIEDCAHCVLGEYKGKKLGTWGHIGTFSFNMLKQMSIGEGGMAITDDDKLATELNKRIIFGESPEVLSSNYRMTELQAAVGVAQLKKMPLYFKEFYEGKKYLDDAIADCSWLAARKEPENSKIIPYYWASLFRGEKSNINYAVFKNALRQVKAKKLEIGYEITLFGTGFVQRPAYMYQFLRIPLAYNNKGCPYNCHLYDGKVEWYEGLCPVAEDVIPRILMTNNMVPVEECKAKAKTLKEAIKLTESGNVEPLTYSDLEKRVLELVKDNGPLEPNEVIAMFDKRGWEHFEEAGIWSLMEDLRSGFPFKLSHAGPRKFAYHDLSK